MSKTTDPLCGCLENYSYAQYRINFAEWLVKCGVKKVDPKDACHLDFAEWAAEGCIKNVDLKNPETRRFNFAVWAVKKAKPVNMWPPGISFGEYHCEYILQKLDFPYEIAEKGAEKIPDPNDFDKQHHAWCKKVQGEAKECFREDLSYGQSSKLVNIFLKALMPVGLEDKGFPKKEKAKWYAVHPPIDFIVLKNMRTAGFRRRYKDDLDSLPGANLPARQKFTHEDYMKVINMIRCNLRECGYKDPLPLWKNERFFKLESKNVC